MNKSTSLCSSFLFLIGLLVFSHARPTFDRQTFQLSGVVHEQGSGDAIPGASLHIIGTSRGARTNAEGRFHLILDSGVKYAIRITALGYRPDTLHVQLFKNTSEDIQLTVAPILGPQITVSADASRKEARRIMHKVIDSKDAWQSQINNYRFDVYSRGADMRSRKTANKTQMILTKAIVKFSSLLNRLPMAIGNATKATPNASMHGNKQQIFRRTSTG